MLLAVMVPCPATGVAEQVLQPVTCVVVPGTPVFVNVKLPVSPVITRSPGIVMLPEFVKLTLVGTYGIGLMPQQEVMLVADRVPVPETLMLGALVMVIVLPALSVPLSVTVSVPVLLLLTVKLLPAASVPLAVTVPVVKPTLPLDATVTLALTVMAWLT